MNGLYQVSNLGNIRSLNRKVYQKNKNGNLQMHIYKGKKLKKQVQKNGYEFVNLYKETKMSKKLVHRLVAIAFIDNEKGYKYINHKDNNKRNNNINNLEFCSQKENVKYAYDFGNKVPPHRKKIAQKDERNKIIKIFNSISEAERETNIKASNISKCCRKLRNKAGGYKWQYIK